MPVPANVVYRFEGDRADVVVVKGKNDLYEVAYQYSKKKDQWFYALKGHSRYETFRRSNAMTKAKRTWQDMNGSA